MRERDVERERPMDSRSHAKYVSQPSEQSDPFARRSTRWRLRERRERGEGINCS